MRGYKRTKAMILVFLAALLVLTACSSSGTGSAVSTQETSKPADSAKPTAKPAPAKFQYYTWQHEIVNNALWFKPLQEAANVEIELIDGGDRDSVYFKNNELKIASNDIPDSLAVKMSQADLYGPQGAFLDWTPLIDKHAPNIKKYMADNPTFKQLATSSDGKIYALPFEQPQLPWLIWMYREDLLAKYNLKAPTNADELLKVLRELRKAIPDKDFYPISASDMFLFWIGVQNLFGAAAAAPTPNGKLTGIYNPLGGGTDLYSPGYKKMIEFVKTLYDERLIDPEAVTGAQNENAWTAKIVNGKAAMTIHSASRPASFTNAGVKVDPNYKMVPMAPMTGVDGKAFYYAAAKYTLDWSVAISAKSKKAEDIVKYYDFLYSEKGRNFHSWGVEGQSYQTTNGKKSYLIEYEKELEKKQGEARWSIGQTNFTFAAPPDNEAASQWLSKTQKDWVPNFQKYLVFLPQFKVAGDDLKKINDINAKLTPLMNGWIVELITGKQSFADWDKFLTELEKTGYKQITEINQKAWDTAQGKK